MTTIVMCSDHGSPGRVAIPGATVRTAPKLCWLPNQLERLVPPEEATLVLGLHGADSVPGRIQTAVRRVGLDPLGVGIVDLDRIGDRQSLAIALAARTARAAAFPGSRPEQVKLSRRPARTTRRSLLSLGAPAYTGAPLIDAERCVAGDGCRACVGGCPADALAWDGGAVAYDKTSCVACGICVTTCPAGAITNPVVTPRAIEAEVRAAVDASPEPIGIRYVCAGGGGAFVPGWYRVELPCIGMLTVGWLLAPLVLGAGGVAVGQCGEGNCELGLSARTDALLGDAHRVLASTGIEHVRLNGGVGDPLAVPPAPAGLFEHGCTPRTIAALFAVSSSPLGFVALDRADVGAVAIDVSTCTACTRCAVACPTDALRATAERDGVRIDFDPGRCVACGQCLPVCPEIERGAIHLERGVDAEEWRRGRRELRHDATGRCELCGGPVAPAAMLERISSILGDEHAGSLELIGRRCVACRGR